jgi:hypothetical protein
MTTEWWVYARNGSQHAFPVGPFTSKDEADTWVDPTRWYAEEHVDAMAGFYEWGVASIPQGTGRKGRFNETVGVRAAA